MTEPTSKDSPLERYVAILEAVAPFTDGLTAAELEAVLDLPKTTVNRLLHGLAESGMIRSQNGRNRTFKLGERFLRLIQMSPDTDWLPALVQKPLQTLADRTGQSAFISKFDGTDVRSITCVAPDTPVRTYVMPGTAMPINATASGKAIMAFQPDEILKPLLSQGFTRFTDKTKMTVEALKEDLRTVRQKGFATDLAEHVAGLGTIAFPIQIPGLQVVYAVGVTGPYNQVIETGFEANCQAIGETAQRLSQLLQMRSLPHSATAER